MQQKSQIYILKYSKKKKQNKKQNKKILIFSTENFYNLS